MNILDMKAAKEGFLVIDDVTYKGTEKVGLSKSQLDEKPSEMPVVVVIESGKPTYELKVRP